MAVIRRHLSSLKHLVIYLLIVRHNSDSSVLSLQLRNLSLRYLRLFAPLTRGLLVSSKGSGEDGETDDDDEGREEADEGGENGIEMISSFLDVINHF